MASNTNSDIWLAGAFAAFSVDLLVYPLDTIKTRIQSPDYKKTYTQDGRASRALFRGLYQGIGSIILVTLPSSGAFFTTYEALKYTLNDAVPPNSTLFMPQPLINAVSSGGAELVSCAILTPAEVIKQNAQMAKRDIKGASPTLQVLQEFKKHPLRLWSGYTALAGRNLPFTAMQFPLFEHLKQYFMEKRTKQKGSKVDGIFERPSITAMSAGIAGSGAAWITTPIDVIKTRMMLAAGHERHQPQESKDLGKLLTEGLASKSSKGMWETAKEVAQTDGIRGFFRGAALRAVWTALGSGLYLGVYEGGRFYLEDSRKTNEGDHVMQKERDWANVKVGIGGSRSQGDAVRKSGWQEDLP